MKRINRFSREILDLSNGFTIPAPPPMPPDNFLSNGNLKVQDIECDLLDELTFTINERRAKLHLK